MCGVVGKDGARPASLSMSCVSSEKCDDLNVGIKETILTLFTLGTTTRIPTETVQMGLCSFRMLPYPKPDIVVQAFYPSTWEAEASLSSGLDWSTQ